MLKQQIESDLKQAMLAGDKPLTSVLRSIKSAVLYQEVAEGARDEGLSDEAVLSVLRKERKMRQDAYEAYQGAGETPRAEEERYQMGVIEGYLPAALSEDDTRAIVSGVIDELQIDSVQMKDMGRIMQMAKQKNPAIDGALVSKIMKEKLS